MSGDHTAKSKFTSTLDYLFSVTTASIGKHFPKFAQPLCQTHDVCWCEECLVWYRATGFTKFRNSCEHFDAQCLEAAVSEHRINQLQFILKYADRLEEDVETEVIRHLEDVETGSEMLV